MSKKVLIRVTLDVSSLLVVSILLLVFIRWVPPVKRGFFCNDMSIRYPYHENTISTGLLFALALVPVLTTVPINEIFRYKNRRYSSYKSLRRELYDKIMPYIFGLLFSLLCTLISKVSTGRLRPYFVSICKPSIQCDVNNLQYIEDYECTGLQDSPTMAINEMRMSFMSGHSSIMAYSMVYLTIYLQRRLPISTSTSVIFRSLAQGLLLNLAVYVGYTRISDYWHHWSDVLMGLIQGSVSAILTAKYLSDLCVDKSNSDLGCDDNGTEVQVKLIKQTSTSAV